MSQTYNATLVLLDYYYVHAHTLSKLFQLIKSSFSQASNHILVLTVRPTWLRNSEFHWWRVVRTSSPKGNDRSPENKQVFSNSSLVNKRFFQLVKGNQLCSQWLTKFWIQSRVVTLLQICQKKKNDALKSQSKIFSMIMCIQNLVEFCPFILKIWSKNQILASIKGHNSVAYLR